MLKKCLLLFFAGLVFVLASCAKPDEPQNEQGGERQQTAEPTTSIDDVYPYPEHDFGGAEIKVLARKDGYGGQDFEDICVEEMNGEVLNDAVYKRTMTVEEKYNVKIDVAYVADPVGTVSKNVKADEDAHQIVQEKLWFLQQNLATQNYLTNLRKVNSITLEAPWYNQSIIKDVAISKKVTVLGGDMTVSDKSGVGGMVFNKQMVLDYGLEDMYKMVREGKWTLDKMDELMKLTSKDLNGDGKMKLEDDQWGLLAEHLVNWAFLIGCGNRLADLDSDGIPYITAGSPKFLSDLDRILDIMYDDQSRIFGPRVEDYSETFMENRAFMQVNVMSTFFLLRGMETDFGIIPIPKLNEQQEGYLTEISPFVSRIIAIPISCKNPETIGAVIDAMGRESTNTVVPAYFDNMLNNKIARDEESIEMLQLIFDTVVYDIGSIFNWGNLWIMHQQFMDGARKSYVPFLEKNLPAIEKAMQKTIDEMQNIN